MIDTSEHTYYPSSLLAPPLLAAVTSSAPSLASLYHYKEAAVLPTASHLLHLQGMPECHVSLVAGLQEHEASRHTKGGAMAPLLATRKPFVFHQALEQHTRMINSVFESTS